MANSGPLDDDPFDFVKLPNPPEDPVSAFPWTGDKVARFLGGEKWGALVNGFEMTEYDLGILAQHYFDVWSQVVWSERVLGMCIDGPETSQIAAESRLNAIERALGAEKFARAIATRRAYWNDVLANDAKPWPCKKCGRPYYFQDALQCPGCQAGFCQECSSDYAAGLGPCTKCGRQRRGEGRHYTGDLCEACYVETLGPCSNCGGKRDLRLTYSDQCHTCDTCRKETIAPCKHCGATRQRYDIDGQFDHGYCRSCAL
jgi:hypothetical protein